MPDITLAEGEMETRLSLALLKNLPQTVRQPVVEGSTSKNVRCILMFESLHEHYAPGGREELESIQRYLRQLPSAQDFKGAMTTRRRWKLARHRAQSLGLPEQAPNEGIAALDSLMKILEKKHQQLAMKINLLRKQPDIIIPATSGLDRYLSLLEVECRRLASEQEVRDARAAQSSEVVFAAEAVAKGKGRLCFHFGKPRAESSKDENKDKNHPPKPEATPEPKPEAKSKTKPEAKPKSEAKAAVAGLLGVDVDIGPRASSVRVIAKAARELGQDVTSEHASG